MAEKLWDVFEELLDMMINAISDHGTMDVSQIKQSAEYGFIKDFFESTFLFRQIVSIDKAS